MPSILEILPRNNDGGSISDPSFRGRFHQDKEGNFSFVGWNYDNPAQIIDIFLSPGETDGKCTLPYSLIKNNVKKDVNLRITTGMREVTFSFQIAGENTSFTVDKELLFV